VATRILPEFQDFLVSRSLVPAKMRLFMFTGEAKVMSYRRDEENEEM